MDESVRHLAPRAADETRRRTRRHGDLVEGAALFREAATHATATRARRSLASRRTSTAPSSAAERAALALHEDLVDLVPAHLPPRDRTRHAHELAVIVDRERARFAAWYEMFPRSLGAEPGRQRDASATRRAPAGDRRPRLRRRLPAADPPDRLTHRKGRTARRRRPDDPGSPWAIGSAAGGHTAVEPALGTLADFDHFVATAAEHGLEVALDYAPHCSPDHPWIREHPDWFVHRPDGSIKCAENPPYTFDDIVPLDFWCADREALWIACRDVFLFWIGHGVRTFRVDNPHTKPFAFWEWVIAAVTRDHPDVLLLAEAFTRPKTVRALAALGFSQSYTYFIWRTTAAELREYRHRAHANRAREVLRPAFFPTTPDVLHAYLQTGGRAGVSRASLARRDAVAALRHLQRLRALRGDAAPPGSEEYLDSEKFQLRSATGRARQPERRPHALNAIARAHRACSRRQRRVPDAEHEHILWYAKRGDRPARRLLIAVNLDPHHAQETMVHVPLELLGLDDATPFEVEDLLSGERYTWRGDATTSASIPRCGSARSFVSAPRASRHDRNDVRVWPGAPQAARRHLGRRRRQLSRFSPPMRRRSSSASSIAPTTSARSARVALVERDQGVWHAYLPDARPGQCYGLPRPRTVRSGRAVIDSIHGSCSSIRTRERSATPVVSPLRSTATSLTIRTTTDFRA
jgi:starch synthase (maltosyl-transferring)